MVDFKYCLIMEEKMYFDGNLNSFDGYIIYSRKWV